MSKLLISKYVLRVGLIALTYHLFLKTSKSLKVDQTSENEFHLFKVLGASGLFGVGIGFVLKIINKYLN